MKFRKKPVVIDAMLLVQETIDEVSAWSGGQKYYGPQSEVMGLLIATLEGDHRANFGDWIIRGVKGEFYPCKPDIFEATYEAVEDVPWAPDRWRLERDR